MTINLDPDKSYLINTSGVIYTWEHKHTLKHWQAAVGGWVEVAPLSISHKISKKHAMLCNEEGLLEGLQPNLLVNTITGNLIVGDVLMIPHHVFDVEPNEEEAA